MLLGARRERWFVFLILSRRDGWPRVLRCIVCRRFNRFFLFIQTALPLPRVFMMLIHLFSFLATSM